MLDLEQRQGKRANMVQTREFICVQTESGRGLLMRDPKGACLLLAVDVSDLALGSAILEALAKSRVVPSAETKAFFDSGTGAGGWDAWTRSLMAKFGYRTKRAFFRDMKSCGIKWVGDTIGFSPSRHVKLEAWEGLDTSEEVAIKAVATAEEIGNAARSALERCVG